MFYPDQHSTLLITVPTLYPISKPAFNNLANVLNYFLLRILCLKNLAKSWSIRVKENFHEKNFDNLATPCGAQWVIAEPPRRRSARERGAPYLKENGKLSVTVRPYGLSG